MLLVFWILTPLQSAIFNTATVKRSISVPMMNTTSLAAFGTQSSILNSNFLNKAYAISWLGESLPPFTTSDFALLPFGPENKIPLSTNAATWSTTVDTYSTSLSCNPAKVTLTPLGYTFSNGQGCSVSNISLAGTTNVTEYMINYIGYFDNPNLDWSLQNPDCPIEHSSNFLALYASYFTQLDKGGTYSNLTALFCQPTYTIQEANVTVNASDGTVKTYNRGDTLINPAASLSDLFNITHFEYILGTGIQPTDQRTNYPDTLILSQYPRLQKYSLAWPLSNMVGYAIALSQLPVSEFASPDVLQQAFERAHRLLFISAFSTLTIRSSSESAPNVRPGLVEDNLGAIVMVRSISVVIEATLGIVAVFAGSLWYFTASRRSNLIKNPASIADVMGIRQSDQAPQRGTQEHEPITTSTDIEHFLSSTFYLALIGRGSAQSSKLLSSRATGGVDTATSSQHDNKLCVIDRPSSAARPRELSLYFGSIFIGFILTTIIIITFLAIWTSKKNGKSSSCHCRCHFGKVFTCNRNTITLQ